MDESPNFGVASAHMKINTFGNFETVFLGGQSCLVVVVGGFFVCFFVVLFVCLFVTLCNLQFNIRMAIIFDFNTEYRILPLNNPETRPPPPILVIFGIPVYPI